MRPYGDVTLTFASLNNDSKLSRGRWVESNRCVRLETWIRLSSSCRTAILPKVKHLARAALHSFKDDRFISNSSFSEIDRNLMNGQQTASEIQELCCTTSMSGLPCACHNRHKYLVWQDAITKWVLAQVFTIAIQWETKNYNTDCNHNLISLRSFDYS